MAKSTKISIYLSFLLRHHPEEIGLEMDRHGWVNVREMIEGINRSGKYVISMEELEEIVRTDKKGRYRFNKEHTSIKACQGHSIPWVEPEVEYREPPQYLYHGTTTEAFEKILNSGEIKKMSRHAVHLQEEMSAAWQSAKRWHKVPVLLKISAQSMHEGGALFGRTENNVWCTEKVPVKYISEIIREI